MVAVNEVPQLVDKNRGSYNAIAPKLEPGKFNKWKKQMLCYLEGMEPYYLKYERRVVVQDQRLKSIIMSCLPDDIMKSVISCVSAKETWTDLVHSFEGPLDTKENRIMDLKLEYQTFRAKSTESLSQTYTRYKTLLNEIANDGVNLSKHEINTLDLADIYGRVVYEDNLIQRRYFDTKKALITTPLSFAISTAFFSNNVIQDFQENFDDEIDERSSKEYLRDLELKYHERALLENSKRFIKRRNNFSGQKANENIECYKCGNKGHFARDCFSKTSNPFYQSPVNNFSSVSKGFQPKFTPKLIQSSPNSSSQTNPKFQKDYKVEYKKMKSKLALLKASPSSPQNPKTFQPKNKGLVVEIFDWDEEEELTKLNHALPEQLKEEKKINEKWLTSSKKVSQCISEQIPYQKKKVLGGELLTESSTKKNENENLFIPASKGYDQDMVPKTKDWVKRLNPDSKLPNFNTGKVLVPESQAINESLESTKASNTPESPEDSKVESFTPLPPLKNLQGASPSLVVMPLTFQPHSSRERSGLGIMKHTKPDIQDSLNKSVPGTITINKTKPNTPLVPTDVKNTEQESKLNELTKLVQMLIDEKVNST
ncbi:retrovirus-related pol polyprotein from transposon TNT 1-94 [Tanacetum coccineum]